MTEQQVNEDPAPIAPRRPDNDECCRSGCEPCVFDLYDQQVERYRTELEAWQQRQHQRAQPAGNPESEPTRR